MLSYGNRLGQQELLPDTKDSHRITDPRALKFLDNAKGPEKTLPMEFKAMASHRLGGFDMERVKVFEDPVLTGLEQPAYARGNEIHVAPGGLHTDVLMHEATHLAQQSAGHTGDLESGANRVAAGGSFAAATAPVSASAAPAQGIFGWGNWKKKRRMKKDMRESSTRQLETQRLREQDEARVKTNLDPRLHMMATGANRQIFDAPTYNMEQQNHVINSAVQTRVDATQRSSGANAFAKVMYGADNASAYAGEAGRRIEAMYRPDSRGGIGENYEYNRNMFDTLKDTHDASKRGDQSLDLLTIMNLADVFRNVIEYAMTYPYMTDESIMQEAYNDFSSAKRKMGEFHALTDMIKSFDAATQNRVWQAGGYPGTAAQGKQALERVTDLWKIPQREMGRGLGLQNIGNLLTEHRLTDPHTRNQPQTELQQRANGTWRG